MKYGKEVNEHSPLRILEASIHGGLGQGNLGVVMARAGVGKLFLFHHDPLRTDAELIRFERIYRAALRGKSGLDVRMAREGLIVEV